MMKALPQPTTAQRDAARHPSRRLLIEAGPGTGKTFTAAERYGHLVYRGSPDRSGGVLVLSFTVGATQVLRRAIVRRWGSGALAWPHRVRTIDSVFRSVLDYLLRNDFILWPERHREIQSLDEWRGRRRASEDNTVDWYAALDGRTVKCFKRVASNGDFIVPRKKDLLEQLKAAECSHADIRGIVCKASGDPELRVSILAHLRRAAASVLVDEAFDANSTDIELLHLFHSAGCELSLIGDPWQALYWFRDDVPADLTSDLLATTGFDEAPLEDCFRFQGDTHSESMADLRKSLPVTPAAVENPDVVVAAEWRMLWEESSRILPLSFGRMSNQLDGLLVMLLDCYARNCGMTSARLVTSACGLLGVDPAVLAAPEATARFGEILALAKSGDSNAALDKLSLVPRDLFDKRKTAVGAAQRTRYNPKLDALAKRLAHGGPHVPGLTVHQAKGDEWDHVGIVMTDNDIAALRAGLDRSIPDHRRLYVAMTRARVSVGRFHCPSTATSL